MLVSGTPVLKLPDLETFTFGTLEVISAPESSIAASQSDLSLVHSEQEVEDVWRHVSGLDHIPKPLTFRSWELFYDHGFDQETKYLSDAGPQIFDAALQLSKDQDIDLQGDGLRALVVDRHTFQKALFHLGIGFESSIFHYDDNEGFTPYAQGFTASGLTPESTASLYTMFSTLGLRVRKLASALGRVLELKSNPSPTKVALAETGTLILMKTKTHIIHSFSSQRSILQIQSIYERTMAILECLDLLCSKLLKLRSEEQILTGLYSFAEESGYYETWLRPIILGIIERTSKPWLNSLGSCLGLTSKGAVPSNTCERLESFSRTFLGLDEETTPEKSPIPQFIGGEDIESIAQTCHGLMVLGEYHPKHPLATPMLREGVNTPELEWQFDWQAAEDVRIQAENYQAEALNAIKAQCQGVPCHSKRRLTVSRAVELFAAPFGLSEEEIEIQFQAGLGEFGDTRPEDHGLGSKSLLHRSLDTIFSTDHESGSSQEFAPPLSLCPVISFSPIIAVQARLANMASLQMLFSEHDLLLHLSIQKKYHLFGDGVFATRLSQALFDPDMGSTERRKGHTRAGVMGLRLGSRESWPPAGSEVRLALMGILRESFHGGTAESGVLPGGLSFGIRELSEEDIERCLDPNSLQALDFLRLQYKPPPPLDNVITNASLDKYDRIFKLLVRMARIVFVVNQISRRHIRRSSPRADPTVTAFRFEALHFVSSLRDYLYTSGIESVWQIFENTVRDISRRNRNDDQSDGRVGLHHLRALHDQMLDRILFALLLRKRQEPIMKLLEETFELILLFFRDTTSNLPKAEDSSRTWGTKELHIRFRQKVGVFIEVCRGLSAKKGYKLGKGREIEGLGTNPWKESSMNEDGNTLEQLLLRLQMNGWYERDMSV